MPTQSDHQSVAGTGSDDHAKPPARGVDLPAQVHTRIRRTSRGMVDAALMCVALVTATLPRYRMQVAEVDWTELATFALLVAVVQVVVGITMGLYSGRWRYGSFEEIAALARTVAVTAVLLGLLNALLGRLVPLSGVVGAGALGLLLTAGVRFGHRLFRERRRRPSPEHARTVVVFGAGEGGAQAVTAMLRTPDSTYVPAAMLDDDPTKANLRIIDVPVAGDRHALADVVHATGADTLLVAIPSADAALVRDLVDRAAPTGVDVRVLPPVGELFGQVTTTDMRPVTVADILGRREVETNLDEVAGYLTGRRVLVTGAGGSIGSELCRQLFRLGPSRLTMLDRDESGLHAVQLSLEGRALLQDSDLVVADLRDVDRLDEIFAAYHPEVVFHAAALKHLPLLEMHPSEAVKVNVMGTHHVLEASARHGVQRFVNISTDKAADPISVLGYSKRITERLTSTVGSSSEGAFLSVRFGNVLGSRGSVLGTFQEQVQAGGPLTVTHPNVTRYFMTIEEAVQLVIQAGAIGRSGEALILDMGEPVRIADVARQIASASTRPIEIVYTGLRTGEKLHETLQGAGEPDSRPRHPLVSHVPVPPLDTTLLPLLETSHGREHLVALMRWLACGGTTPTHALPRRLNGKVNGHRPPDLRNGSARSQQAAGKGSAQ